jgi:CubicO group peptidase (beta-lactamase class C family)
MSEFETIANRFVDNGYAKGIAFALVRGDSVEIRGYGQANEDGAAPDAHTLFEIGSIAKVFTGITLATMVADGEVALEEPLADLVPASVRVPEHGGNPITLLTLATHSSGLPPFTTWKLEWDMAWYYEFLSSYELTRDPGAQYEYSNFGFLLLEDALSMRSKKPCGMFRLASSLGRRNDSGSRC